MNNKLPARIFWGCAAVGGAALVGSAAVTYQRARADDPLAPARANLASLRGMGSAPQPPATPESGATAKTDMASPEDNTKTARTVSVLMSSSQYLREPMTPALSARFFDLYLDALDPQHIYFTQEDLKEWASLRDTVGFSLAEKGDTSPAQTIFDRMRARVDAQVAFANEQLKNDKWTFTNEDTISTDFKNAPRPANIEAAQAAWLKQLRVQYLSEKLNKQKHDDIVKTLNRRYTRIARTLKEEDSDDIFELYVDTLARSYDPHSDYFGKATTENFGIQMQLSLFGIGATLQSEDGYVKIQALTPGGPAAKKGTLKVGDRIVAVTQGKTGGEPVDVIDMKLNKVVDMIRGPKDSYVRLTILPAGAADSATRQNVVIQRDKVQLSEQAAKAQIIELPANNASVGTTASRVPVRIGVVALPSFYQGENDDRSATADVRKLLVKLKAEKVSGIIFDLRNNGGGSLQEAIGITGLFIKQGPVVQVRGAVDKEGHSKIQVDNDDDPSVAYDGPLVVLTNRLSASASEIVSGALKDYGRAVVVGDKATFGKGSVQAVVDLSRIMASNADLKTESDPGTLHLTIQKFYRPGGATTQLEGVVSDITLPSLTELVATRESKLDFPLPFDKIAPAKFAPVNRVAAVLPQLKTKSANRVSASADWKFQSSLLVDAKKVYDAKTISLNEAERVKERDENAARLKTRQAVLAARPAVTEKLYAISLADAGKPGLPVQLKGKALLASITGAASVPGDDDATADDAVPIGGKSTEKKTIPERDITLDEARRVLLDYISLSGK